jgi:uncharacterized repeat protein (TIGR03803 family)
MPTAKLVAALITILLSIVRVVPAQTYSVLHSFTGEHDGSHPLSGLVMDRAGNLYGTTSTGGNMQGVCGEVGGCGTVFRLSLKNGGWIFTTLYAFQGDYDGQTPQAPLTIGPDGALYGTTVYGGADSCTIGYGCGTVFKVTPPASFCGTAICGWKETVLFRFPEGIDGISTPYGGVVFDEAGNLYGASFGGGIGICSYACGTIYELIPSGNGHWGLTPLYEFTGGADGASPMSTLLRDSRGNLYGTAYAGGFNQYGTVFELSPSGQNWTFKLLHEFQGESEGQFPMTALVMDAAGNLYGDNTDGGPNGGGVVFQLSPFGNGWSFQVVDSPTGGVTGPVNLDNVGNVYGTTGGGGSSNEGQVFKLAKNGNSWLEQNLHSFNGADGATPYSGVIFDSAGRLYGTTDWGGGNQVGVVWEIAP